jgi:ubiquinone/menaquinone biosynthesis C-methylase UbiE
VEDRLSDKYDKSIKEWNKLFLKRSEEVPTQTSSGNETIDAGIGWLCEGSESVLDFGCGDGTLLFLCALMGTKFHIGIDLSENGIEKANLRKEKVNQGKFDFIWGGVEKLKAIKDGSVDAVILSNILDNLYPQDVDLVLREVNRILKENGKILVKLNPFITDEQIEEWQMKAIKEDLLDNGFILLNKTTSAWNDILSKYFSVHDFAEILYEEHQHTNRLFLLERVGDQQQNNLSTV